MHLVCVQVIHWVFIQDFGFHSEYFIVCSDFVTLCTSKHFIPCCFNGFNIHAVNLMTQWLHSLLLQCPHWSIGAMLWSCYRHRSWHPRHPSPSSSVSTSLLQPPRLLSYLTSSHRCRRQTWHATTVGLDLHSTSPQSNSASPQPAFDLAVATKTSQFIWLGNRPSIEIPNNKRGFLKKMAIAYLQPSLSSSRECLVGALLIIQLSQISLGILFSPNWHRPIQVRALE